MPGAVTVTFLYIDSCPSYALGLDRLRQAAERAGVRVRVTERLVADDAEARALRFPGSPTYLVSGRDAVTPLEGAPIAADACRAYRQPDGGIGPVPHVDDLAAALRAAADPSEDRA